MYIHQQPIGVFCMLSVPPAALLAAAMQLNSYGSAMTCWELRVHCHGQQLRMKMRSVLQCSCIATSSGRWALGLCQPRISPMADLQGLQLAGSGSATTLFGACWSNGWLRGGGTYLICTIFVFPSLDVAS